jgi:hypothetical protein
VSRPGAAADGGASHVPPALLDRYAVGAADAGAADVWWAVDAHLELCADCRNALVAAVERHSPRTTVLVERVRAGLTAEIAIGPPPSALRRWRQPAWARWWATPVLPRLGMTVLVVLAAVALDVADAAGAGRYPSLVLLVAPVAPLVGVAAAWSRGLDPAYELVVARPRAGFDLVLRRAAAVLSVVIPALAVAGWLVGVSPARWLVPCLAFTVCALALGEVVGLHRAASGLALGWAVAVAGPSLVMERPPALLASSGLPGWVVVTAVLAVVLVIRRRAYTVLASGR